MRNTLRRSLTWARMFAAGESDARQFYALLGEHVLSDEGHLANMGLWSNETTTLQQANEALFDLARTHAQVGTGEHLVDVGCGFGTNVLRCAQHTAAARLSGINVSRVQLDYARARVEAQALGSRVEFLEAWANALPFAPASVDAVISTEAAFHFDSRVDFFREAARVLKPGGRLVLIDLVVPPPRTPWHRLLLSAARRGVQMPATNIYGLDSYASLLRAEGFAVEQVQSLAPQVLRPFRRWFLSQPLRELARYDVAMMVLTAAYFAYPWDYGLFVARRA